MKKGQAALEFLMTYGWAILVVLIVIGALAYFGVLNPNLLVPEKCTLVTGLNCKDYKVENNPALTPDVVYLALENGLGKAVRITNITLKQVADGITSVCWDSNFVETALNNGATENFVVTCDGAGDDGNEIQDKGRKAKLTMNVSYYYADSTVTYTHVAQGEMLAIVG